MSNKKKHTRFEEDEDDEYAPTDSEDEYTEHQKELLQKASKKDDTPSDSENEVYGVHSESESNDDIASSDIEGQEDDGLPDTRAWGKDKRQFYSTDYVDPDYGGYQGKDASRAELEEEEAKNLQKQLIQQLDDDDFVLDIVAKKADAEESSRPEEIVKTDISKLSKRQTLELLRKESPEFFGLVEDFKSKITIAKDFLSPTIALSKEEGRISKSEALLFVKTYYEIILNYCTNIGMYLLLKTSRKNIQNHPIIKRLYQYRQLLSQLDPIFESTIKPQLEIILLQFEKPKEEKSKNLLSLLKTLKQNKNLDKLASNDAPKSVPDDVEQRENTAALEVAEGMEVDEPEDSRRGITYQMAKNKGLTPHRNKEQRNPRVKHRNKYRKAKIRRKGAVREVRKETTRYGGEISGIKTTVSKSVKIKS